MFLHYGYKKKLEPITQSNIEAIGKSLLQNWKTSPKLWKKCQTLKITKVQKKEAKLFNKATPLFLTHGFVKSSNIHMCGS